MPIKFQYNKTYLNQLNRELKMRENALPTLIAKESALRLEVKKAKEQAIKIEEELLLEMEQLEPTYRLWGEMPETLVSISDVEIDVKKIAGVKTPILHNVVFLVERYSAFFKPGWIPGGIETLKKLVHLHIQHRLALKKTEILEYARKKTTQKVNLYEKVQIPDYKEAILKIKRFLEDKENLAKSSQKILKAKIESAEAA